MTRHRSLAVTVIAAAVCMCAVGAANAYAVNSQLHECIKTGGNGSGTHATKFNEGCKEATAGGTWETVKQEGRAKIISTSTSSFTLSATVAGVKIKIECSGAEGEGEAENTVGGVAGEASSASFTGCGVTEPAGKGCTVPSTINTNALAVSSKEMSVVYVPKSGETFVTITIGGATCPAALKGEKPVTGSASTVVSEAEPTSGEFTATSGSALKIGGQVATLIGKTHAKTKEGTTVAFETP